MLKKQLKIALSAIALFTGTFTYGQGGSCAEMEPICTDLGISFTAGVGDVSEPGNDYGCLFSQPNPSWYYLEISDAGDIIMSLTAPSDIDFIIWGPFDDLGEAIDNCGSLGGADSPIVDCSYSPTASETPEITDAEVGEVYILLITNYADLVQDVDLTQTGGEGATDCDIVDVPPCSAAIGSFNLQKNGEPHPLGDPIYLCEGDSFSIQSNGDYVLPNDTIPAPIGDGVYSAQMMWLVYDALPSGDNPATDPGYTGLLIANETDTVISDANDELSGVIDELGCGTYYFVPIVGDDGIGENGNVAGPNDNGGITWDKDGNGCYDLGDPIQVTYACPITATSAVNCDGLGFNGVDINITGGQGDYAVISTGDGAIVDGDVPNGGTATVGGLENGDTWTIQLTDGEGCTANFTGFFAAPVINPIVITPAVTCPDASFGNVDVTILDGSGNGPLYGIVLNGVLTPGTNADYGNIAGTAVTIFAIDGEGCITDSVVTITSAGHFIDIDVISQTSITCFGDNDGTASISANPENAAGADEGEVVSIVWTAPSGATFPGDETNTSRTGMAPGIWIVTVTDDFGCEVTIPIEITTPAALDVFVNTQNDPNCYGFSDGSIDLGVTGGTGSYDFTWRDLPGETSDVLNTIGSGTYWGYATDDNGCIDSVQVMINQPDSLWAEFTIKDVLCFGDSTGTIVIDTVYNSSGPVSYFWNLGGAVPNPAPTSNLAEGLPAGTYVVTIQDEFCENIYEFTLKQNPPIVLTTDIEQKPYCRTAGFQLGNGVISGSATGGVSSYSYQWINLETEEEYGFTTWGGINPGTYQLTTVDAVGCTATKVIEVDSLNPQAIFSVDSDQLNADCQGTEIVEAVFSNQSLNYANPFNPNAETIMRWNFDDGAGFILSDDINETFNRSYPGEKVYEVCLIAYNVNGCSDTACKEITVFGLPEFTPLNIFTPDGDGVNDIFTFNNKSQAVKDFKATIVDRWGVVMFEFNDITDGWDGTNKNNTPVADGVYFYKYEIVYTNSTKDAGQGTVQIVTK